MVAVHSLWQESRYGLRSSYCFVIRIMSPTFAQTCLGRITPDTTFVPVT